jgi:hypothetical protein
MVARRCIHISAGRHNYPSSMLKLRHRTAEDPKTNAGREALPRFGIERARTDLAEAMAELELALEHSERVTRRCG